MAREDTNLDVTIWANNGVRENPDDPDRAVVIDEHDGYDERFSQLGGARPDFESANELLFRIYTWIDYLNRRGSIPPHDDEVNYVHTTEAACFVTGDDGNIYVSRTSSGPNHGGAVDPVGNDTHWKRY